MKRELIKLSIRVDKLELERLNILIYLVIVSVFIAYLGFLAIKVRGEV